jgi:RES domain-containing protein
VPSLELVARLDALGTTELETVAFRHVSVDTNPKSGTGARIHGGRWNPPNSFATLYLAFDVDTVAAEFRRAARRHGLSPEQFLPRELHRFEVRLAAVVDLRDRDSRAAIELSDADLRADDPRRCQEVGDAVHSLGLEGLLAPSAAGPGTVLAVFLEKLQPGSVLDVIETGLWEPPAI